MLLKENTVFLALQGLYQLEQIQISIQGGEGHRECKKQNTQIEQRLEPTRTSSLQLRFTGCAWLMT